MALNRAHVARQLAACDLQTLFVEELGWDYYGAGFDVQVAEQAYHLQPLAQKRGLVALSCAAPGGSLPDRAIRRKIEQQVARVHREHLLVFRDGAGREQVWQWVKRVPGRPLQVREHHYTSRQPGEALIQKLEALKVAFDEEDDITLSDMAGRTRAAFDVERTTRRFYDTFKKERNAFEKFVTGIDDAADEDWYVSVMLNRLMFVYFVQRKGFLAGDPNYLRNKLREVQGKFGADQFYSFYRTFLLRLFHEGLGAQARTPELEALLGEIPYLNGGIFQLHEIEARYHDIQISDAAFERILDFFDQYQWHLDDNPLRQDNEINPDVLGYIFEKYINQKEMGAYYTKEDITDYISKNTVIPYLFDAVREKVAEAFAPEGPVWSLLAEDPDRYIYQAVRKGTELALPAEIAAGVDDVSARGSWNTPTSPEYGLPTEIWRETVARRKRCEEVRSKLAAGDVTEINDLITYNLDIRQFAQDVIERCEGANLLNAFWGALSGVTVLDPTCGSGAFLFAALNILEPLYEAAIARMREFLEEEGFTRTHPNYAARFQKVCDQIVEHPNEAYFILKSIMVNNLYGVDIMDEAVEICKLRLFLKLAATLEKDAAAPNMGIEPLPDIDFNIRAGNTLVGYATLEEVRRAISLGTDSKGTKGLVKLLLLPEEEEALRRIEEQARDLDRLTARFREQQTELGGEITAADKQELRDRLVALEDTLNRYLARESGVGTQKAAYEKWLESHRPFHWFIEFYGIVHEGDGFDAIIGNPPYIEYRHVRNQYQVNHYSTIGCSNLYAFIIERCNSLVSKDDRVGMIIPLSAFCTDRMIPLIEFMKSKSSNLHIANFSWRPGKLFEGVNLQLSIFLQTVGTPSSDSIYTTKYQLWESIARPQIFSGIFYSESSDERLEGSIAKIGSEQARLILDTMRKQGNEIGACFVRSSENRVYYRRGGLYWKVFVDFETGSSEEKIIRVDPSIDPYTIIASLSSSLWFWYLMSTSDCRHLGNRDINTFPFDPRALSPEKYRQLAKLGREYVKDLKTNSERSVRVYKKKNAVKVISFYVKRSKSIIDEIDRLLANHFGFTDEELDFIINYDIKYRMGDDLFDDD